MKKKITNKTHDETVKLVMSLFSFAESAMTQKRRQWEQNYKYWSATNPIKRPTTKDNVRIPIVFMISDSIQAILTDNSPKIKFLPQEENDIEYADTLDQVYGDYYWEELNLSRFSEEMIWWATNISGSGIGRVGIDRVTGEQYIEACNSFACFPDPSAKSLKTCEFFDYVSVWSIADLRRVFGEAAADVKPQDELGEMKSESGSLSPWKKEDEGVKTMHAIFTDSKYKREYGRVLVHEMWMKSDETEPIEFSVQEVFDEHNEILESIGAGQPKVPEIKPGVGENHVQHLQNHYAVMEQWPDDPDVPPMALELLQQHIAEHEQEELTETKLKYPEGKIVTVAGGKLLDEMAAPFGLPYIKYDFIINPSDFWGQPLQEYIQTLQDNTERRKRQISDSADRAANPPVYYDSMSGYNPADRKGPGAEIAVRGNPNMAVHIENPPAVPQYVQADAADSERLAEKITGLPEILQGYYPKGSPSGVTIKSLQEALGPRMRKASRHYEEMLRDMIRLHWKLLPYEDPLKIISVLGKDGEYKYVQMLDLPITGKFNIRVVAGSTLPTSRMEKFERALKLMEAGIYDAQAVLEYLDDPQRNAIIERMSIVNQQAAEIEFLKDQNDQLQKMLGAYDASKERDAEAGGNTEGEGN